MSLLSSPADFEQMFEHAPISLWLEDYSALKRLFTQWREEGVTDLLAHVAAQPERAQQCAACLKVLQVNRRTLELFGGQLGALGRLWRDRLAPTLHVRQQRVLLQVTEAIFGRLGDRIRDAAAIPADRHLDPERMRQMCRLALREMLE